jgi:hypothetical protein
MSNAYHGKQILGELSDAQVIGYSGAKADSTNMVEIGGATGGQLWINVYAQTAISIATGEYFYIELESWSADLAASAIPPFSTSNSQGINQATGTAESDAHYYLLHKTSADGALVFAAGDLITQCAIPEDMLRLLSHDFVQLTYITDKTDPGVDETVDAFVWVKPS